MKGLMLKEMYALKQYWKMYAIYIVVFGGITLVSGQTSFFAAMSAVLVFSLPISTFTIDEQCGWNRMAIAMPLSRRQIVGSKYVVVLLMVGISVALQVVLTLAVWVTGIGNGTVHGFFVSMLVSTLSILFVMMIVLPFIFKYGSERGRLIMIICFGVMFGFIMSLSVMLDKLGALGNSADVPPLLLTLVATALVAAAVAISYSISCRIYAKKEF